MIWSRIFFWVHSSEQKWQVLASSLRDMRKSSNDSPCCYVRCLKFLRSTDSLIWPSTYCCMASTMVLTLPLCSVVRPRLSTIVSVSREKQRVSACTCLAWGCLSSSERLT